MIMFDRRIFGNIDWSFLLLLVVFSFIGLLNLYSASYQTDINIFKKQLIWIVLGLFITFLVSFIDYKLIKRYSLRIYVISIISLLLVLFYGREVSGSKSWISIGSFFTMQPSEFTKIAIILVIARFYEDDFQQGTYGFFNLIKPLSLILLALILVMLQPDLGTSLIIILISATLFLFMGMKWRSVFFIIIVLGALSYPTWQYYLKDYQKDRINTFIDPTRDPLGAGYNAIQSKIAVGSGKFVGKGYRSGSQTHLRFIPAQQTDFAYSVFAEEWGFLGSIFTLLIYFMIILWMLDTSGRAKDKFSMVVSLGVAAMFFWHFVINVGMVIGLLPIAGVPLLLFSYGGSSVLTAFIGAGLVLGIRMRRFQFSSKSSLELTDRAVR